MISEGLCISLHSPSSLEDFLSHSVPGELTNLGLVFKPYYVAFQKVVGELWERTKLSQGKKPGTEESLN